MVNMKPTPFSKIKNAVSKAGQWYFSTAERALEQAYSTALKIRAMEDEHFAGKRVAPENGNHTESVFDYFESQLNTYLKTIKTRLREFNASKAFLDSLNQQLGKTKPYSQSESVTNQEGEIVDQSQVFLEKLKFIDETLEPYRPRLAKALVVRDPETTTSITTTASSSNGLDVDGMLVSSRISELDPLNQSPRPVESIFSKTSFLPRSILRTADKVRREIDPRYPRSEEEVVKNFRDSRFRTKAAVKFLVLLLVIPLITQQVSKLLIISPLVDQFFKQHDEAVVFFNPRMKAEAAIELQHFAQEIDFEVLINDAEVISPEEKAEKLKHKAIELANHYSYESFNALKNVFADFLASVSFVVLLIQGRSQLKTLRSFIDETVYGLSDSAKAFLIILFTDVFVGFHSTHGWEVLLEGFLNHFGLPENRTVIYTFIATFPVILDAMFKYWIFRYLNQISPSAVATYRNMNE